MTKYSMSSVLKPIIDDLKLLVRATVAILLRFLFEGWPHLGSFEYTGDHIFEVLIRGSSLNFVCAFWNANFAGTRILF